MQGEGIKYFLPLLDFAGVFLTSVNGNGCECVSVGQAARSLACPHRLEGGGHAMEGTDIIFIAQHGNFIFCFYPNSQPWIP